MIKYGKSFEDISELKKNFIDFNDEMLKNNDSIKAAYLKQPIRQKCKICGESILNCNSFISHGIKYYICTNCGHVNGECLETTDFTSKIYEESDYGRNYRENEHDLYRQRMERIYIPKVNFMLENLKEQGVNPQKRNYLDVGAGSGYFVGALLHNGISSVSGIEVSNSQVQYGNDMLGSKHLECIVQNDVCDYLRKTTADVVSFIGVFEHIINLNEILNSIQQNNNIKYVFFSVPMFSYSVILESLFPAVFNRLLGGAHTHIFTDKSLEYLYKKLDWNVIGEWRFGTDIMDVMRTVVVQLEKDGNKYLASLFSEKISDVIDDIQLVIDKSRFCSEIHVLAKKTN